MADVDRTAVTAMSRELLSQVAPGEMPLFTSVSRSYFAGSIPTRGHGNKDDLLGFGVGEAVVMLSPFVLRFAEDVWKSCEEQATKSASGVVIEVFRRIRARFGGDKKEAAPAPPSLSTEELQYVRSVGRRCVANFDLSEEQKNLLVESLVGSLAVPEQPRPVTP